MLFVDLLCQILSLRVMPCRVKVLCRNAVSLGDMLALPSSPGDFCHSLRLSYRITMSSATLDAIVTSVSIVCGRGDTLNLAGSANVPGNMIHRAIRAVLLAGLRMAHPHQRCRAPATPLRLTTDAGRTKP
jgi:hypothetical protein